MKENKIGLRTLGFFDALTLLFIAFKLAEEYEQYCVKHEVSNGVVKQDTKYIRGLYQDLSRNHQL